MGLDRDYRRQPFAGRHDPSGEAKLTGWCGTTNNVSVDACGVWKPVKLSLNGMRTLIRKVIDRAQLEQFLEAVGWPELLPDNGED